MAVPTGNNSCTNQQSDRQHRIALRRTQPTALDKNKNDQKLLLSRESSAQKKQTKVKRQKRVTWFRRQALEHTGMPNAQRRREAYRDNPPHTAKFHRTKKKKLSNKEEKNKRETTKKKPQQRIPPQRNSEMHATYLYYASIQFAPVFFFLRPSQGGIVAYLLRHTRHFLSVGKSGYKKNGS